MDTNYKYLLQRLEKERTSHGITQTEISRILKMSQSHYCKVENGQKFLGYNELSKMCTSDIDVYYIFTGRHNTNNYDHLLSVPTFDELLVCLNYINMIAQQNKDNKYWSEIYYYTRYIEFSEWTIGAEKNIFKATRVHLGKKQSEMANTLGVDVKKLRSLEINDLPPNSDIIFEMYKSFGVSPSLFLRDKRCLQSEISCLIDSGDEEIKQRILSIIEFTLENI